MCLAKAYIEVADADVQTLFCENVAHVEVDGERITVVDLIGRPYETQGIIREVSFVGESRIVISPT